MVYVFCMLCVQNVRLCLEKLQNVRICCLDMLVKLGKCEINKLCRYLPCLHHSGNGTVTKYS